MDISYLLRVLKRYKFTLLLYLLIMAECVFLILNLSEVIGVRFFYWIGLSVQILIWGIIGVRECS